MATIETTIYPQLKSSYSEKELEGIFKPTDEEINFANLSTRTAQSKLNFLITLKCFQRLGYFPMFNEIPFVIIEYIALELGMDFIKTLKDHSHNERSRDRHIILIREFLKIKPFDSKIQNLLELKLYEYSQSKDDISDLINISIEELVKERVELPAFSTLNRISNTIRFKVYDSYYESVYNKLKKEDVEFIDKLLEIEEGTNSIWSQIKKDSRNPTLKNLNLLLNRLTLIGNQKKYTFFLKDIPDVKLKRFSSEAKTLDAAGIKRIKPQKRYTITIALLNYRYSKTLDDLTEMLIKIVMKIHNNGRNKLDTYHLERTKVTDNLISNLKNVIVAYRSEGSKEDRFEAMETILKNNNENLLEQCEAHLEYSGNNYFPFLWNYFKGKRSSLLKLLDTLEIKPANNNLGIDKALEFFKNNRKLKRDWIDLDDREVDLSWIDNRWWKMITGYPNKNVYPKRINRKHFEVCLLTEVVWHLKSGNLFINGSDEFSDYREQLISWKEYDELKESYSEQVELPSEKEEFIDYVKNWLEVNINETDSNFPKNKYLRIENGEPILSKLEKKETPSNLRNMENLIKERLKPLNILDILTDTEHWLNWSSNFNSVSGFETKVDKIEERIISTAFCFGCNLGPTQTSRALESISRKQIHWVDKRYMSLESIENAITTIINAYNAFSLPKYWGSGKGVAADGTKWDLYLQNLLSEYHIRYGGYGGIGYYHVSDNYIALFSHFIPCGVWEAVYILDGLLNNKSDIKPDTIYSDTQGQNAPVFGLAFLLGIRLMPRIRNWKHYTFYKVDKNDSYENIDELFTDSINWDIIRENFDDMMRVVISIKEGKIKSSTLLKKLSTYNKSNKLYQGFRELGRAVRTGFLMNFVNDPEMRSTIQASTNKVEAYNGFAKWSFFGEKGIITRNDREMQKKIIKYNQLVTNCIIFHNANSLTNIIANLIEEGHKIDADIIKSLSPYITGHINRFGKYKLNLKNKPPELNYERLRGVLS